MNILITDGSKEMRSILFDKLFENSAAMIELANIKVGEVGPLEFIQMEPKLHYNLRSKGPRDKYGRVK